MKSRDYGWANEERLKSQSYLFEPIKRELDFNNHIIDIGCGNGAIARDLLNYGYNVYGIDGDRKGIEIAQNALPVNDNRFFCIDIETEDLPNELKSIRFDVAISTEVVEHVYSPETMIRFIYNVLDVSGSKLIISAPYHGYLKNLLLSIIGRWDKHFTALWVGGHIKFWSKKTLTILLEQNGFRVVRFYGCGRLPLLWKSMILVAEKE